MPLHRKTGGLELPPGGFTERRHHDRILHAVRKEDGRRLVGGEALGVEPRGEHLVAGKREDASEALGVARSAEERHCAALRETREHDALARYAAGVLAADQLRDERL
jgi:hypothetical protein